MQRPARPGGSCSSRRSRRADIVGPDGLDLGDHPAWLGPGLRPEVKSLALSSLNGWIMSSKYLTQGADPLVIQSVGSSSSPVKHDRKGHRKRRNCRMKIEGVVISCYRFD